ncbi:unnamed protein product [Urochloa humidicola]
MASIADDVVLADLIAAGSAAAVEATAGSGAAAAVATAGSGAAAVVAPAAAAPRVMRWNNNTSGFVLRRMVALVNDGSKPDKVFKDKDVNSVAKALKEYCGEIVSPTQVYNHLRKWRQKWSKVAKLKDLSGALWDGDASAIMLEHEHFLGHCKDHSKDAEFWNCPIRFYTEMEAIFSHSQATGKWALGSGEPLGQNHSETIVGKEEGPSMTQPCSNKAHFEVGEGSKTVEVPSTPVGGKRKRGNFTEDEVIMLTNMSDAVNNVANALRETGPAHVDANLYLAVMDMPGFPEEALIVAYTFLLDNKAQGRGFVNMSDAHRTLWLRTFLAKNYYV